MLGSEREVNTKNVIRYLSMIEQRTLELLQYKQYLAMKKMGEFDDYGSGDLDSTENKAIPVAIVAPSVSDERFMESELEIRPLVHEEISSFVKQMLDTRSPSTNQGLTDGELGGREQGK